jgi:hypothetical protein
MARIRSMKPEFRRSRTVTSWPRDVRLTWALLWGYLDDEGRGEDDLPLLKADMFPRDKDVTEDVLDEWLWSIVECKANPPLCRYTVDGCDYLHAVNWDEHQRINRPTASKQPHCPAHEDGLSGHVRNRDASRNPHVRLTEPAVSPPDKLTEPSPPSRVPAEQGAREQGARVSATRDVAGNAGTVVKAYVEGATSAGLPTPSERLRGKVGKDAQRLMTSGANVGELVIAARRMGARGWDDLDRERQLAAASAVGPAPSRNQQVLSDSFARAQAAEATGTPFGELT